MNGKEIPPLVVANNTLLQNDESEMTPPSFPTICFRRVVSFYFANEFIVLVVLSILLAKAYPPLGNEYVQPDITASWIAVIIIFIFAGLSLKTDELVKALQQVYFNSFVQVFNFAVVSSIVFGFSRLMITTGVISTELANGMVICGCLPQTVNMCVVLTKAAGGDEAAAIFNTAFANMVGIFLSPVLILGYIGVSGDVAIGTTFYKLSVRVLLPIFIGQVLQKTSEALVTFVKKYKPYFSKIQEYALIFIIYTVFCGTFAEDNISSVGDIFVMIFLQFILMCIVLALSWICLRFFFRDQPQLCVMGLYGCTHKTVTVGIPLIKSIYDNDPNLGLYTLPLLIWHTMQLVIGSALAPRLKAFVAAENERLGIVKGDSEGTTYEESELAKGHADDNDKTLHPQPELVQGTIPADNEQTADSLPKKMLESNSDNTYIRHHKDP